MTPAPGGIGRSLAGAAALALGLALAVAGTPALAQDVVPNAEPLDVALKTGPLLPEIGRAHV